MSESGSGAIGRREVAVRCFAAEYDDATLEYSESDEERAPNYVVTPTGARVNRLFVVGVLTEVEPVSDDVLRARVVDPTGAFVVYAGQYQPDAKTFLERAEPPEFVAVTGKARTFEPDDADVVYTSVRPESINAVDADTRDRWTVQAAEFTVERVAACAAALQREERGEALREALLASGVDPALAAGIPRAIEHYGTTGAYLAAVRETALSAAEVVAGDRDEVEPLALAPDEGGSADVDLAGGVEVAAAATAGPDAGADAGAEATPSAEGAGGGDDAETPAVETAGAASDAGTDEPAASADAEPEPGADEPAEAADASAEGDDLGDFDDYGSEATPAGADGSEAAEGTESPAADAGGDELYELDEAEREAIEEEYGTEFSTGSEVEGAGEADIETPGPVEGVEGEAAAEEPADEPGDAGATADAEATEDGSAAAEETGGAGATAEETAGEAGPGADTADAQAGADAEEAGAPAEAVDIEDAVVAAMGDLDEGDGADREAVVERVVDEHDADRDEVEDAIQDALMGGRCYEPQDGRLKAI